jgi:hypothetical protein
MRRRRLITYYDIACSDIKNRTSTTRTIHTSFKNVLQAVCRHHKQKIIVTGHRQAER